MELDWPTGRRHAEAVWGSVLADFPEPDEDTAARFETRRDALLSRIGDALQASFRGSKPRLGQLSPGCQRCGDGSWSCLFTTSNCNARCFFCPKPRSAATTPLTADGLTFPSIDEFVAYARRYSIDGVSFSGGETLLAFDELTSQIERTRQALGPDVYIWAYTNGRAGTRRRLARLAEAGLDELRFNTAAVDYRLDDVALAIGLVPTVTVEIPVIPEHLEQVAHSLRGMAELGVDHVNLHQLMVYGVNHDSLAGRGYHVVPGPTLAIIESELATLELLAQAAEYHPELAIQYCSTVFKTRWHVASAYHRASRGVLEPWETRTEYGYLRSLWWTGPADLVEARSRELPRDDDRWRLEPEAGLLLVHPELAEVPSEPRLELHLGYARAALVPDQPSLDALRRPEAPVAGEAVRVVPVSPPMPLEPDDLARLRSCYLASRSTPPGDRPHPMDAYERIGAGLPSIAR